jgi:hypothetical protein
MSWRGFAFKYVMVELVGIAELAALENRQIIDSTNIAQCLAGC